MVDLEKDKKPSLALKLIPVIVAVLIAAAVGGYFYFTGRYKDEAVNSFSLLMNRLFEPGGWRAAGYDFSLSSKTLTANKVELDPTKLDLPSGFKVSIDSIEIVNGLKEEEMSNLLKLTSWQSETDTHLADRVTIKAFTAAFSQDADKLDAKIDDITFTGLDLVAADSSTPPAPNNEEAASLSFVKSARLGQLVIANIFLDSKIKNNEITIKLANVTDTDMRIGQNLESFAEAVDFVGSYSVKESVMTDLSVNLKMSNQRVYALKIAKQTLKDFINYSGSLYELAGVSINVDANDNFSPLAFSLGGATMTSFDLRPFIDRMETAYAEHGTIDADSVYDFYLKLYRVSDIFSMPYTVGSVSVSNSSFSIANEISMSLETVTAVGPFQANKISPSMNFELKNFILNLPTKSSNPKLAKLVKFVNNFGQSSFNLSYTVHSTYDEKTATLKYSYAPLLNVDGLVSINTDFSLDGLTQSLFEKFAQTSMDDTKTLLFEPEFSNLGLAHFRYEIVDQSLTDRLLAYYAKTLNTDAEILRQIAIAALTMYIEDGKTGDWENVSEIAEGLTDFLEKPTNVVIEFAPSQPLSMNAAMALGFDTPTIVNSLNGNLISNGGTPIPLRLLPTRAAAPSTDPPTPDQEVNDYSEGDVSDDDREDF